MDLTLRVIRYQNLPPQQEMHFTIGANGCKIGRNAGNDVVLPDPERWVSGFHAEIHFRNGRYTLLDISSNGTFVNGSPRRVPQGQEVELNNGDEIVIGAYELQVAIAAVDLGRTDVIERPPATHDPFDPFDQQRPDAGRIDDALEGAAVPDVLDLVPSGASAPERVPPMPDAVGNRPADPLLMQSGEDPLRDTGQSDRIDGFGPEAPVQAAEPEANHTPQENAYLHFPEAIPEDFDLLSSEPEPEPEADEPPEQPSTPHRIDLHDLPEPPAPTAADVKATARITDVDEDEVFAPPAGDKPPHPIPEPGIGAPVIDAEPPVRDNTDAVAAFLAGLGCDASALSAQDAPGVMHSAGELLRTLTEGLMAVMMSRASFKSELRIEMTMIRAAENNPFKFSVGVDDALSNLLFRHSRGYLPPIQAAQEALDDVQAHQMAMLAGLRAALQALLGHFDPAALEGKVRTESMMDNLVPMAKKAKCWDRFNEVYAEVSADTADDFMNLFGPIFSRAYEDQVARLKQARRDGAR